MLGKRFPVAYASRSDTQTLIPNTQPPTPVITPTVPLPSSEERAKIAAKVAADNRGTNIVILDLREVTPLFDFFVIVTGTSRRQLHAICEEINHTYVKELGDKRLSVSGYEDSRWIAMDYGDIVIHVFDEETRDFYALEELWLKAKVVPYVVDESHK